jgi:hypothetical protein
MPSQVPEKLPLQDDLLSLLHRDFVEGLANLRPLINFFVKRPGKFSKVCIMLGLPPRISLLLTAIFIIRRLRYFEIGRRKGVHRSEVYATSSLLYGRVY